MRKIDVDKVIAYIHLRKELPHCYPLLDVIYKPDHHARRLYRALERIDEYREAGCSMNKACDMTSGDYPGLDKQALLRWHKKVFIKMGSDIDKDVADDITHHSLDHTIGECDEKPDTGLPPGDREVIPAES